MPSKPLAFLLSSSITAPSSSSSSRSTRRRSTAAAVSSSFPKSTPHSLRLLFHLLLIATPIVTTRSFLVSSTTASVNSGLHHPPKAGTTIAPTDDDNSCPAYGSSSFALHQQSASTTTDSDSAESSLDNNNINPDSSIIASDNMVLSPRQYRSIRKVMTKPHPHWVGDGFKVLPVFSNLAFTEHVSPFLMFDYGEPQYFKPQLPGSPPHGVGQHPHRGFETVTIAFQGQVEHHDSAGNRGVIGPGDVQWMTAGRGIVHEEYHSKEFAKTGGTLEMCQLWVNLPAAHKMTPPKYQEILNANIPVVELKGRKGGDGDSDDVVVGTARVIAGDLSGTTGAASTFSPVHVWDLILPKAGAEVELPLPSTHNAMLFVRRGRVQVLSSEKEDSKTLGPQDVALLDYDESATSDDAASTSWVGIRVMDPDTSVVVLAGQPLREPIANHGPFVMNTQDEIRQAFADYRSGKMGQ